MLGRKTHSADAVHGGVPSDFDTNQLAAGEQLLGFWVEEGEMLIDLEVSATYSGSAAGTLQLTLFVDDVNVGAAAGLYFLPLGATNAESTAYFSRTLRLAKGFHTAQVRVISDVTPTLEGGTVPADLVARRHSHPASLGHGVDSKTQLIQ